MFWIIGISFVVLFYLCTAGIIFYEESRLHSNQLAFVRAVIWPRDFIVWLKTLDWSREDS